MIAKVNGREVKVMSEDGMIVRRIWCGGEVESAYVSGDQVNIQLTNGRSEIFKTDGTLVRRF